MGFPVYKMLLQPIIENTILHAFENVKEGGMINIEACVRKDGSSRFTSEIMDAGWTH